MCLPPVSLSTMSIFRVRSDCRPLNPVANAAAKGHDKPYSGKGNKENEIIGNPGMHCRRQDGK